MHPREHPRIAEVVLWARSAVSGLPAEVAGILSVMGDDELRAAWRSATERLERVERQVRLPRARVALARECAWYLGEIQRRALDDVAPDEP